MPGFDRRRFVDISAADADRLQCSICLGIVSAPIELKCCQRLYCRDCIVEWLRNSKTCPLDRSAVTDHCLKKSEKCAQLLNGLNIRCEFREFGCEQVCPLRELDQHLADCEYNPERKCAVCGLMMGGGGGHDCVQLLLAFNNRLIGEMTQLRVDNEKLKRQIDYHRRIEFEAERHLWDNPLCFY